MKSRVAVAGRARLFLAIPLPSRIQTILQETLKHYTPYVERVTPQQNWHITLIFLGDVDNYQQLTGGLAQPLTQTFLPTISLTHVGVGCVPTQLWAYANPSPVLANLHAAVADRVHSLNLTIPEHTRKKGFVPHIKLARLSNKSGIGIADYPLAKTFVAKDIHVYRSELSSAGAQYTVEGTISLSAVEQ